MIEKVGDHMLRQMQRIKETITALQNPEGDIKADTTIVVPKILTTFAAHFSSILTDDKLDPQKLTIALNHLESNARYQYLYEMISSEPFLMLEEEQDYLTNCQQSFDAS